MRRTRTAIAGVAAVCAAFVLPNVASACDLPTSRGGDNNASLSGGSTQVFSGHLGPAFNGKFVQIPFEVEPGMKGMKIRYCFEKANGADDNPTLDLGVYGAKPSGAASWTQAQRRGWSGSAVRTIGIGEQGYTDEATYGSTDTSRKTYVPTFTSRAYKPGPVEAGEWAAELGAGWIDPDGAGVDWKIEVTTTNDAAWSASPFQPDPYTPYVADPNPGWYAGDLHAHGEMEPGNATMKRTFDEGFKPLDSGGSGLDFMTIVDHNNDNSRAVLGGYADNYPGKLIVPGVEVTTYNGHTNAQGSDNFADFRFSEVYRWDDADSDDTQTDAELTEVRDANPPSSQFQNVLDGGGWTQINHPKIYQGLPASTCRGCIWGYSDEQTDFSKVSAIELQTGPAGLPADNPSAMNSYTVAAIGYYEHALATGAHIAAVGSSDDHQGATFPASAFDKLTYSPVGRGATVVHGEALSTQAIIDAVKAGHTYVKPFGADSPDVELTATAGGGTTAIPGDSITGPKLDATIAVKGAGSAPAPGPYTLYLLQDGIEVDSIQVSGGDDFTHTFSATESGRYSFKLTRPIGAAGTAIEAYSTPVWFTYEAPEPEVKPSNAFRFGAFKANRKKGTATIKVKVASPGRVKLTGPGLKAATARVKAKNSTVTLILRPKAALKKKLRKRGSAKVRIKVTNTPTGNKALSKSKTVKLLAKKTKRKRR